MYVGKTIKLVYSTNIFSTSTPWLIWMKYGYKLWICECSHNGNEIRMKILKYIIWMKFILMKILDEVWMKNYISNIFYIKKKGSWLTTQGSKLTVHMVALLPHDTVKLQFVCKFLLICKFFYLMLSFIVIFCNFAFMLLFIVIITCLLLTLPMLYSNIDTIIPTCFVLTPIDSTICTFNVFNPNAIDPQICN
jgi:hypothetical protein